MRSWLSVLLLVGCAHAPVATTEPPPPSPDVLARYERYIAAKKEGLDALVAELQRTPPYSLAELTAARERSRNEAMRVDREARQSAGLDGAELASAQHTRAFEPQLRALKHTQDALDAALVRIQSVPFSPESTASDAELEQHLRKAYAHCAAAKVTRAPDGVHLVIDACTTVLGDLNGELVYRATGGGLQIDAHRFILGDLYFDGRLLTARRDGQTLRGSHLTLDEKCGVQGKVETTFTSGKCTKTDGLEVCMASVKLKTPERPAKPRDYVPDPIGDELRDAGRLMLALPDLVGQSLRAMQRAASQSYLVDPEVTGFASLCSTAPPQ
jgi:hypothetical protein